MEEATSSLAPHEWLAHLQTAELFRALTEPTLHDLLPHLEIITCLPQTVLMRQGEPADGLYLVVNGRLQVVMNQEAGPEVVVGQVGPGELVGEMESIAGGIRTATVHVLTKAQLIKIPETAVATIRQNSQLVHRLEEMILRRWYRNQLAVILPKLFGPLSPDTLTTLEQKLVWVQLRRGEILVSQGVVGEGVYVLVNGRLQAVVKGENDQEQVVGEIVAGESIGEMAFLTGAPTTARVYALRDSILVKFPHDNFQQVLEQYPQVMRYLTQLVIRRLQQVQTKTNRRSQYTALDIVLLPVDKATPIHDFAHRLLASLSGLGPVLLLDKNRFEQAVGLSGVTERLEDDPQNPWLTMWLNQQEVSYRFVLYVADAEPSLWTRRCLRQADQILWISLAGSLPRSTTEQLAMINKTAVSRRLVLLHSDSDTLPQGTHHWLDAYPVEMHHHVRWGHEADFARLARFVAGQAVGLALSGGGARGLAHIGVIHALEEVGIPIDLVGGTSMGSIISAEYASGWGYAALVERNRHLFRSSLLDYTLPIVSLTSGRRVEALFNTAFGESQIEDLWLPYYCVSANLTQAAMVIHRRGLVRHGVRASCSLPGLMPPFIQDGDILIDGAWMDNLPMDVMRQLCGQGTVIAVDVSPPIDLAERSAYGDSLSGWQILWRTLNPFASKLNLPTIAEVVQRAGEIGNIYRQKHLINQGIADLYLRPPVEHYQLLNFKKLDEIIQVGYDYARERIAAWKASGPDPFS